MFINPNPRNISIISHTVALFYTIFKSNNIDMKFFDTTFYDLSDKYCNPDKYRLENLNVVPVGDKLPKELNSTKKYEELLSDFRKTVERWKPNVIMASAMESTIDLALDLLKTIRDLRIPTVLGGVFPIYNPDQAIRFDEIDVICIGEGEKVIVPICRRLIEDKSLSGIPNIWIKEKDGSITKSLLSPPVDINENPPLDVSIFEDSRFYRPMAGKIYRMFPVETHRGCSYKCNFCLAPVQNEKYKNQTGVNYFRKKTIENVMKDIRYFTHKCKAEYLLFWADNFLLYSKNEIDEFCEAYADIRLPFFIQTYPTTIDEYKIKKLSKVGLHRVGIGIEHGNEEFRRMILNRHYTNKAAIEGVKILKKHDIQFSTYNIVGFPTETPELHMDSVLLNRIMQPNSAACSIFTPFHGIKLRDMAIELGYLKDSEINAKTFSDEPILEMPTFSKKQILGKSRTFILYMKFPESRFGEIKKAEAMTSEGDRIWLELKQEYLDKYS